MKSRKLLDALENVNDEYIEAAALSGAKKRPRRYVWIAAAACVALLLIGSAVGHRLKSLPAEPVTGETTVAGNITAEIDTDFSSAVGEPDSELPIATKPEPPASTKDAGEPTQVHLPNKPDEPAHAVAPTVVFNGENYIICGSAGEGEILKKVGLPEDLTADCAGRHIAYIYTDGDYLYLPTDKKTDIEMFEYAAKPNKNVYILLIDGTYYAAVLRDESGYRSINE